MTKNLETADKIVKLSLAFLILILYYFGLIQGPFAEVLMVLSCVVFILHFINIARAKDG
jgi:hypothetical protein